MLYRGDYIRLELTEVIRINQLLHTYDFAACKSWYDSLPQKEQCALVTWLYRYGNETYPTSTDYQYALATTRIICSPELQSFAEAITQREPAKSNWVILSHFPSWINTVDDQERSQALALFFYIFCHSDQQRRIFCGNHCHHWWHQDLSDPEVVARLLNK